MDTKEKKEIKKYMPIIIAVFIIGAVSFYGGIRYGVNNNIKQQSAIGQGNYQQGERQRGTGFGQNGGAVSGSIISKDDKSITVQTRDGGSKIIFVSSSTEVMESVQGTSNDLFEGQQITAIGNINSDGSITGQTIQIRPTQAYVPRVQ